jgi:peptidyl-prolyl cis-trans isomerase SurA
LQAIAAAVVVLLTSAAAHAVMLDRIVAVIDKDVITWSELFKQMEFEMRVQLKGLEGKERLEFLKRYERDFLERMIDIRLQILYAESKNIAVKTTEIDASIEEIKKRYGITQEQFEQALVQEGFTIGEYRRMVGDQLVLTKLGNVEVGSKLVVTDEEITRYIKEHALAAGNVQYRLREILLPRSGEASDEAMMRAGEELFRRVENGEDFGKLAERYSKGPNAAAGGDMGFIARDEIDAEMLSRVETLREGGVTRPFLTSRGLHLVQLTQKKGAQTQEDLKSEVRYRINQEKSEKAYKNLLKTLKEKRFIKIML